MTDHFRLTPTELRLALRERGYHPVPVSGPDMNVSSAGKRPTMSKWETRCLDASPEEIQRWGASQPGCINTGLLCGRMIGADIDVLRADLAEVIADRARQILGPTPLVRIGREPKVLLGYQLGVATDKLQTACLFWTDDPAEKAAKVEVLARGQQFVGFGTHPETRAPYRWPEASPLTLDFADLPEVTEGSLRRFVTEAEEILRAAGAATRGERRRAKKAASAGEPPPRPSVSERAAASTPPGRAGDRDPFWRTVNERALANLHAWVPQILPGAEFQPGTGAYRMPQDGYEEDLSIHPDGIKDWSVHDMGDARDGNRSAIDIVLAYLPASSPGEAARWLCDRLSIAPEDIGWRDGTRDAAGAGASSAEATAEASQPAEPLLRASPFTWCDPARIPMRDWVYGKHLIRKFVSVTVAPGGVGKSSLAKAEALAMVSGQDLLGEAPACLSRVWYWNGEDPLEELQRRFMATALHYGLTREDIEGRLFVNSGRDTEMVMAEQSRTGVTIAVPVVEAVKATIRENGIDVVIIDPFVSSHRVSENDNGAIDRVAKLWAKIADETSCAVELIHHARKTNGAEVAMEDGRGAVALLAAARSGRILNVMSQDEAERAGVERRRLYFRVDNGKANLAPPPEGSTWFHLASVPLGNGHLGTEGDSVGVVTRWRWPNPLDDVSVSDLRAAQQAVSNGRWRENVQAKDWVGKAVAIALKLDVENGVHKEKVKRLLQIWTAAGMFRVVTALDANRIERSFVEVGEWAAD